MNTPINEAAITLTVSGTEGGTRLDKWLSTHISELSRSRLQALLAAGRVQRLGRTIDDASYRVKPGDIFYISIPPVADAIPEAEDIPLSVVYEDRELIVIDKPAGLVVHPAAGNHDGTMLNALLHYAPELVHVPRAGIVHRIDKETSGLLVVARTLTAQADLVEQLQERSIEREYEAVAIGVMTSGGSVDAPIGRHAIDRKRMAVTRSGKPAVSHYRVAERFRIHTHIKVHLETGRTHQIRVHMAYIHHPLLGDPVYGGRLRIPPGSSEPLIATLRTFKRQALHAARLALQHPESGEPMEWHAPLPDDMTTLIKALHDDRIAHEE